MPPRARPSAPAAQPIRRPIPGRRPSAAAPRGGPAIAEVQAPGSAIRLSAFVKGIALGALEDAAAAVEKDIAHALARLAGGDLSAEATADAAQARLERLVEQMGAICGVAS